ncbi:TetR/AcrR family transcriptional regulator [Streptacidiphilus jiangxiensis]|uniref:DNA-binding transcriptional regulator, AcrR family n=1 Tax=Streptacidiphilus jiangxiensis TaxID=235985 RepID=A0A1H7KMC5_STRJI|nr:TetR/AcrR family transcriptional regulator [Streptacidiphilus jiangxiensis]SEK87694.1 DNA-binding transcriptional regulator, AcrR family [Streptacidiphilus jiangxiensis]
MHRTTPPVPSPPVAVRRRGRALEQAIFEATLEQLIASGYARLSMEAVAAAAQTGKASLYRRWGSKEQLVLDALGANLPPTGAPPDTGGLRTDLLAVLDRLRTAMSSRPGCAARAVISELDHERAAAFIGLVHQLILDPAHLLLLQVVRAAAERGEIHQEAATPMVLDIVPAMMMYRAKTRQGRFTEAEALALVDEVLLPVLGFTGRA